MSNAIPVLKPGDSLLYSTPDITDFIIEFGTGGPVAHIEKYVGPMRSVASRNGLGVAEYPLRLDGLVAVLRPAVFDLDAAMAWFRTVNGDGYDWIGLTNAFTPGITEVPKHLFCSAFGTLFDRAGGFNSFHPDCPADKIWPVEFLKVPGYQHLMVPPGW